MDLERAYDEACRAVETPQRVSGLITEFLETRPIVARRHYIETGNLRYWGVPYCGVEHLLEHLSHSTTESDGLIIVPLCESPEERKRAIKAASRPEAEDRRNLLIAVPQPLNNLASLVQKLQRWVWVSTNTQELNADRYGREEVSRQRAAAESQLQKRIQSFVGWKQLNGRMMLEWFYRGRAFDLRDGRKLLASLSRIFDEVYSQAVLRKNSVRFFI